ncbi:Transposase-associated domain [Sesbania bispinosa]|nr:Transposase-associated domain [Sesbania bispinosa]
MDKLWIKKPRNTLEYQVGLDRFLDFAFEHSSSAGTIVCPCSKCGFRKWLTRQEMYDHLLCKPFPESYTVWCHHGETLLGESVVCPPVIEENLANEVHMLGTVNEDPTQIMINDAFGFSRMHANEEPFPPSTEQNDEGEGSMPEQMYVI